MEYADEPAGKDGWVRIRPVVRAAELAGIWGHALNLRLLPFLQSGQLQARLIAISKNETGMSIEGHSVPAEIWLMVRAADFDVRGDRVVIARGSGWDGGSIAFEGAGMLFLRQNLVDVLDLSEEEAKALCDQYVPVSHRDSSKSALKAASTKNAGPKVRTQDWEKFSAALVAVANEEGLAPDAADSAIYEKVVLYLQARGYSALCLASTRQAIRRARTWINGFDCPDDDREIVPD